MKENTVVRGGERSKFGNSRGRAIETYNLSYRTGRKKNPSAHPQAGIREREFTKAKKAV